jgi:hypothetical protein
MEIRIMRYDLQKEKPFLICLYNKTSFAQKVYLYAFSFLKTTFTKRYVPNEFLWAMRAFSKVNMEADTFIRPNSRLKMFSFL